jgi:hypothetical protein
MQSFEKSYKKDQFLNKKYEVYGGNTINMFL